MRGRIAVLGAGMVGIACALELQRRGASVTLVDRRAPGMETSYGNAGVMARSSLLPFNHPGLWRSLPRLLGNRSAQLRHDPWFLARNLGWALGFLASARQSVFERTTVALDALIRLSMAEHRRLLAEAGAAHRLRDNGWIFLYRSSQGYEGGRLLRQTLERFGITAVTLDAFGLSDLEPDLAPVFSHALWIKDAASVDSPGRVAQAYAALFAARGGAIQCRHIERLASDGSGGWQIHDADGVALAADRVVLALGPWTRSFLAPLGIAVPMAFERGYHMHYSAQGVATLRRPVYDVAGGYVLSPMQDGLRLTTGVELADRDAPPTMAQLEMAEKSARQAFALGERLDASAWIGSRPTLPDSRPMIGELTGHAGLWLAFGHQHIGFCTGPGTAALLGALMFDEPTPIDPQPFAPGRFRRY
jgi:D-amino-acid dehydrogenase